MNIPFPCKLLLFGEYSLLKGSQALAVPYFKYSGQLSTAPSPHRHSSSQSLQRLWAHLRTHRTDFEKLDWEKLERDIAADLWFDSNIPSGYGLGSSGAVCAAVLQAYMQPLPEGLELRKSLLARMENAWHGNSSGLDPLVSLEQRPLRVWPDRAPEPCTMGDYSSGELAIFLVDTRLPRQTGALVGYFMEQCELPSFRRDCLEPLCGAVNGAVESFLQKDAHQLWADVDSISGLQRRFFLPMIPEAWRAGWDAGLNGEAFRLKLCGAGGGGFLWGVARDWAAAQATLPAGCAEVVFWV